MLDNLRAQSKQSQEVTSNTLIKLCWTQSLHILVRETLLMLTKIYGRKHCSDNLAMVLSISSLNSILTQLLSL